MRSSAPWSNLFCNTINVNGMNFGGTGSTAGFLLGAVDNLGNIGLIPSEGSSGAGGVTNTDASIAVTETPSGGASVAATGNFTGKVISTNNGASITGGLTVDTESISTSLVMGSGMTWRYNNGATTGAVLTSSDAVGDVVWAVPPASMMWMYGVSTSSQSLSNSAIPLICTTVSNRSSSPFWFIAGSTGFVCPGTGTFQISFTVELKYTTVNSGDDGVSLQILRNGSLTGIPANYFFARPITGAGSATTFFQLVGGITANLNTNDVITFSCATLGGGTYITYPGTAIGTATGGFSATFTISRIL